MLEQIKYFIFPRRVGDSCSKMARFQHMIDIYAVIRITTHVNTRYPALLGIAMGFLKKLHSQKAAFSSSRPSVYVGTLSLSFSSTFHCWLEYRLRQINFLAAAAATAAAAGTSRDGRTQNCTDKQTYYTPGWPCIALATYTAEWK